MTKEIILSINFKNHINCRKNKNSINIFKIREGSGKMLKIRGCAKNLLISRYCEIQLWSVDNTRGGGGSNENWAWNVSQPPCCCFRNTTCKTGLSGKFNHSNKSCEYSLTSLHQLRDVQAVSLTVSSFFLRKYLFKYQMWAGTMGMNEWASGFHRDCSFCLTSLHFLKRPVLRIPSVAMKRICLKATLVIGRIAKSWDRGWEGERNSFWV